MLDLERLEKKALIFLLALLLVGTGVIVYKKSCPSGSMRIERPPMRGEAPIRDMKSNYARKININSASVDELMSIKGVGKVLASRIVDHRSKNGLFLSPEDLKKVPGIGEKLFSKIKDMISLE